MSIEQQHCCTTVLEAMREGHLNCLGGFDNAQLMARDEFGQTPLHHAVRERKNDFVKELIEKAVHLREIPSNNGEIPAHIAAAQHDVQAMELLLKGSLRDTIKSALHRDVNGTSLLMAAVAHGDNDIAKLLVKRFGKAVLNLSNHVGMLPLHVAASQGNLDFLRLATKYDNDMVNVRDEFGCTASVYAVQGGCLSSVRFLVEKARSETTSVSSRGQSLLHIASLCGHEHIVRWLIQRTGTDAILETTNDLATAVHCAAFSGSVSVLHQLLSVWSRKKRQQILAMRDTRGNTPLHLSAINNHLEAAMYLLENKADATVHNSAGHTAQSIAATRNHKEMATLIEKYSESGRNKKSKSRSMADIRLISSPMSLGSTRSSERADHSDRAWSPRDNSSGYSSSAENNGEPLARLGDVTRHRMRFIEDETASVKDSSAQTDTDLLLDRVKLLDDETFAGLGLSAVEDLDRELNRYDVDDIEA